MTVSDFMAAITAYYGGFEKQEVFNIFIAIVKKIKEPDLERILAWFHVNISATWKLDAKTLNDAITASGIQLMGSARTCAVCGTVFRGTGLCPECAYDPATNGTPKEYRVVYEAWKTGRQSFDFEALRRKCMQNTHKAEIAAITEAARNAVAQGEK